MTFELQSCILAKSAILEYFPIVRVMAGNVLRVGVVTSCSMTTVMLAISTSNWNVRGENVHYTVEEYTY